MKNFGPDWNRNGKTDTFDHLMTLEMMNNIETEPVESRPKEKKEPATGIYMGGKKIYDAEKDSDGMTIFKAFLVTALCIGGIVFPFSAGIGGLASAFFPLGAVALSVLILKNN